MKKQKEYEEKRSDDDSKIFDFMKDFMNFRKLVVNSDEKKVILRINKFKN